MGVSILPSRLALVLSVWRQRVVFSVQCLVSASSVTMVLAFSVG